MVRGRRGLFFGPLRFLVSVEHGLRRRRAINRRRGRKVKKVRSGPLSFLVLFVAAVVARAVILFAPGAVRQHARVVVDVVVAAVVFFAPGDVRPHVRIVVVDVAFFFGDRFFLERLGGARDQRRRGRRRRVVLAHAKPPSSEGSGPEALDDFRHLGPRLGVGGDNSRDDADEEVAVSPDVAFFEKDRNLRVLFEGRLGVLVGDGRQDDGERPDVSGESVVRRPLFLKERRLLWRQVALRAEEDIALALVGVVVGAAEVDDLDLDRVEVADENIFRFDVLMGDAVAVEPRDALGELPRDAVRRRGREFRR
mmetsp:Transcript_21921/g.70578  ORF Transcript_21921/g.70578 Transcript_21921/m.70578 type:complete len:309 (-) Transcript_21921:503-1429(-)